ncbi:hypothetical protein DUT90_11105 [Polaribacter sp. WD7]|uniref:hypothetical protein n=1 Tax=Polaribacter sp. WD7 TaxID=2269061 RepID=UPI000DF2D748|nr:hypothetical protein [Polaribacter sp. WD7]RCS26311.1 hypothetical protein DUT90_11105 [Polaribacter sp. WD7]
MKNLLFVLICLVAFTTISGQSKKDIANVYIKRSEESLGNLEIEESLDHFNKAMKYIDTITSHRIARLGTYIHFELDRFKEAQAYAKQYFLLAKNKKSEEYQDFLELFVNINEEIETLEQKEKQLALARLQKEKELRKIDSLKTMWRNKSEALSLKVDSIYTFNKDNLALFEAKGFFGVMSDRGEILVKADTYQDALHFDGFFILKNTKEAPTKIFAYINSSHSGYMLPSPSEFNALSTHYGKVMLPRGNGRLVTYPNNSYKPMVYDLNARKFVKVANEEELLKDLKRNDVIDKSNKDGEVKIAKEWYRFGGHLGGGIHPLYLPNQYKVNSFLCSIDGSVLNANSTYQNIGFFYNNKSQAVKGNKTIWINQNGTKVTAPKDESGKYTGNSKVVKLENGKYQIMQGQFIVLGGEKLEKQVDFLRSHK